MYVWVKDVYNQHLAELYSGGLYLLENKLHSIHTYLGVTQLDLFLSKQALDGSVNHLASLVLFL